jgi:hypothetical protein
MQVRDALIVEISDEPFSSQNFRHGSSKINTPKIMIGTLLARTYKHFLPTRNLRLVGQYNLKP